MDPPGAYLDQPSLGIPRYTSPAPSATVMTRYPHTDHVDGPFWPSQGVAMGRIRDQEADSDAAWPSLAALNSRSILNFLGLPSKSGVSAILGSGRRFSISRSER